MFSTCSELTPRAPIPDGRMAQFMQPCLSMWAIWGSQQPFSYVFQVFTVDQIRPILQFFYFWSDMIFKLIDRWSEMILTTDVRPWPPRFTLISPNWLLICALTVFEIKIDFWFIIPCSKCPWYQYWCALQQYLMSILGITFPCQFRCSSRLAWFNLEISAIIMHIFSSTFHF